MTFTVERSSPVTRSIVAWDVVLVSKDRQEAVLRAGLLATIDKARAYRVMSDEGVEQYLAADLPKGA